MHLRGWATSQVNEILDEKIGQGGAEGESEVELCFNLKEMSTVDGCQLVCPFVKSQVIICERTFFRPSCH